MSEIDELRKEVERLRAREEWLARELAAQGNVYGYEPFCPMPGDHKCEWHHGDLCRTTIKARTECWRKAAEMETRENPGKSGNFPENEVEMKPCLFCGKEAEVRKKPWNAKMPFFVACTNERCLNCGPEAESKEKAIEAWNKR